jgi:hypothetical protein
MGVGIPITEIATANPLMNGSVAVGTSVKLSRGDHVHPTDTSRADRFADIRYYGALCDGVTDDTTAVQAALNASKTVYIPIGTTVVSNLTTVAGQEIFGSGTGSILKFKSGSTGYMIAIAAVTNSLRLSNFAMDGGSTGSMKAVTSAGTRSGVYLRSDTEGAGLDRMYIYGFDNIAVGMNGGGVGQPGPTNAPYISSCNISYNYCALDTAPSGASNDTILGATNGAEYLKIVGNTFNDNRYGIIAEAGNALITGNCLEYNGYNLYVNGVTYNGSHGSFVGNLCNHGHVYNVYIVSAANGFQICGNQMLYGDWVFTGATNFISVAYNNIRATNMTFAGYWVSFVNNTFAATPTSIVSTATSTVWNGNFDESAQAYLYSSAPMLSATDMYTGTHVIPTTTKAVTNGGFDSDTGWTKGTGWTIADGVAHHNGSAGFHALSQNIGLVAGVWYVIKWTITRTSGTIYAAGGGGTGATGTQVSHAASGTYVDAFKCTADSSNGILYLYSTSDPFTGDIDNVSVWTGTLTSTITSGDLKAGVVGSGLFVKEGTNAKMGVATLVGGTATVATCAVRSTSRIFLQVQSLGTVTAPMAIAVTTITDSTSFVITSEDATDTSVVAWLIVEPS